MEEIMKKRQKEADDAYEAQWDSGRGAHHPDYSPEAIGDDVIKADRATEELYLAIVKNDIRKVYEKIEQGADVSFVYGTAYQSREGYTPLMVALHRGRLECAKALLRAGADPNFVNKAGDHAMFWAIDGGVEIIKLCKDFGADLNAVTPKDWTPLSYARAKGKYGATEEKGVYPEDVLKFYGANKYGSGPLALGQRSPRQSYNPAAADFLRERGSYQHPQPVP